MPDRQKAIRNLLLDRGKLTVDELAGHFSVTGMTIRRDLDQLEGQGVLTRVHGGCIIRQSYVHELPFAEKERRNQAEKEAIARAAIARITDGEYAYLDTGTTCTLIARYLHSYRHNLHVFTNNLPAAMALFGAEGIEVVMPGGVMGKRSPDLTGGIGLDQLAKYRFDVAIVGADALDPTKGEFFSADIATAVLSQRAQERADRTLLCVDSSKLNKRGMAVAGVLDHTVTLVTDSQSGDARSFNKFGADVVIVEKE